MSAAAEAAPELRTHKLLIPVLSVATGALVANLYYSQPLIGTIGPQVGTTPELAGAITSLTQIGYGIGLFFVVPLADLVENKLLVLTTFALTVLALLACATFSSALPFFVASFLLGVASSGAQVLLPFVAHLTPEARRGRVVGNVMAGVLAGIMLARPVALFLAGSFGWRSVFWYSAVLVALLGCLLAWLMPRREPRSGMHYGQILASMVAIFRRSATLRRRGLYQMLMFGAFNMFWTTVPLLLASRFRLGEHGIGVFALAGAGGALAAPVAGRLADRGLSHATTAAAMAVLGLAFAASFWVAGITGLLALAVLALLIDGAVQTNQVVSQRLVFAVPAAMRGRVNASYMTCLFVGGAIGSTTGTVLYHQIGWGAVVALGALISAGLLLACLAERGPAEPIEAPEERPALP